MHDSAAGYAQWQNGPQMSDVQVIKATRTAWMPHPAHTKRTQAQLSASIIAHPPFPTRPHLAAAMKCSMVSPDLRSTLPAVCCSAAQSCCAASTRAVSRASWRSGTCTERREGWREMGLC